MPALENVRLEALAQALARGLPLHAATAEAGFSRQNAMSKRRVQRPDVVKRVWEIEVERYEADADLRPLIAQLGDLADKSGELNTASAMVAARGLIADAAKLKGLLPKPAAKAEVLEPVLTTEEWIASTAHYRK